MVSLGYLAVKLDVFMPESQPSILVSVIEYVAN
jgi:hypothetical protein